MKKTNLFKLVIFALAAIFAAAALAGCACGGDNDGEKPEVNGTEKTWNRITVFVPEGMELTGSADGSTDKDIVYVQDSSENAKYFLITLCTEQSAKDDVEAAKKAFSGEDVQFKAGKNEWTGVKYKLAGEADCFNLYANINGQTVLVTGSRYAHDSAEAKAVLGTIKIAD